MVPLAAMAADGSPGATGKPDGKGPSAEERKARIEQCKANPEKCRAEKKAKFEQRFKLADADGNGMISRAEAAKNLPRLARKFERFDTNKDGQVTVDEIAAVRKAKFERRKPRPEAGKI